MEIKILVLVVMLVLMVNTVKTSKVDLSKVKFNKKLHGNTVQTLIEISLEECWANCEQRAACHSLNYQRLFHICELKSVADDTLLTREKGYVYIEKQNVTNSVKCGNAECQSGEVCDIQTEQCIVKECQSLDENRGLFVKGNLVANGSRSKIQCRIGFVSPQEQAPSSNMCLNGTWNALPNCLPVTCKLLAEMKKTISKTYSTFDEGSRKKIKIFCDFRGANKTTGYTFFAPYTLNSKVNLTRHYTRLDHMMLRFLNVSDEFELKVEVMPMTLEYYNVSVFLSNYSNFPESSGEVTEPNTYLGFFPGCYNSNESLCRLTDLHDQQLICKGDPFSAIIVAAKPYNSGNSQQCQSEWKKCSTAVSGGFKEDREKFYFTCYRINMRDNECPVQKCDSTVKGITFGLFFETEN